MPRWSSKGEDAELLREQFRLGRIDPNDYSASQVRDSITAFQKYSSNAFRNNIKKIAEEFRRDSRVKSSTSELIIIIFNLKPYQTYLFNIFIII